MSDEKQPMIRRARNWARPRRWSILVEAVLASSLALAAWPIAAGPDDETPEIELVTAYLEALREGDVEKAESYIDPDANLNTDRSWLTAEALSSDWEIESVRHRSSREAYVHAVISSGGQTAESVFHVEGAPEDGQRITNPHMRLRVDRGPFAALDLNGRRHVPEGLREYSTVEVTLFPGFYRLFEGVPGFSDGNAVSFLAMPQETPLPLPVVAGDAVAGDDAFEERLNADLAAWIDSCVQSAEPAPAGCPFSAESPYDSDYVDDGVHEFAEVQDLAWAVGEYPRLRIDATLALDTVTPGWVTLSGSGVTDWEGTTEEIRSRCGITVSFLEVTLLADGRFEFTSVGDLSSTCDHGLA